MPPEPGTEGTETTIPEEDETGEIPTAPVPAGAKTRYREPTPYEIALRQENAKKRATIQHLQDELKSAKAGGDQAANEKAADLQRQLTEALAAHEQAKTQLQTEVEKARTEAKEEATRLVADATSAAQAKLMKAEVKAAAIAAGLQHVKGLDMLDLSGITANEQGDVVIPEDFFAKAKAEFPFLFADPQQQTGSQKPGSTGNPTPAPTPAGNAKKNAKDMTPDEWKAAQAAVSATGRLPG